MTPSSGFINLLEWLTECRETFYSLDYQFIVKGYNPGTALRKRCTVKAWSETTHLPLPQSAPGRCSPGISMCSPI